MVFSSTVFLFIFLPLVLLGNFLLAKRYRNVFLLIASLVFYAWGEGELLMLMLASISINYVAGLGIGAFVRNSIFSKITLGVGVTANLALLVYYKYFNFITDNLKLFWQVENFSVPEILLPIGISFFTFQGLSYLVDVYRGETSVQRDPLQLGLYIALFPQLIAGPIVRYHDIAEQIVSRSIDVNLFTEGVIRFIRGLAKKVLIANTVALIADKSFELDFTEMPVGIAWIGIIAYTLHIYYDFSGYSDMAIGLGKMLGFRFRENFNYPYISSSVKEFWRRWHISLSTWFRDYLYIPLGGNKKGTFATYRNLIIVFFLTGLWHGASWNFIVWGLFHGFFLVMERINLFPRLRVPLFIRHLYLLLVVVIGWVFFRADNLSEALTYIGVMFGMGGGNDYFPMLFLNNYSITIFILAILFSMPLRKWIVEKLTGLSGSFSRQWVSFRSTRYALYLLLFMLSLMELAGASYNPFIYFRF